MKGVWASGEAHGKRETEKAKNLFLDEHKLASLLRLSGCFVLAPSFGLCSERERERSDFAIYTSIIDPLSS